MFASSSSSTHTSAGVLFSPMSNRGDDARGRRGGKRGKKTKKKKGTTTTTTVEEDDVLLDVLLSTWREDDANAFEITWTRTWTD